MTTNLTEALNSRGRKGEGGGQGVFLSQITEFKIKKITIHRLFRCFNHKLRISSCHKQIKTDK